MTKKRTTGPAQSQEPTTLVKPPDQYRTELDVRIEKGESILKSFTGPRDFERVQDEYKSWHSYNEELLKASFNDPFNEYKARYEQVGEWTSPFVVRRTHDEIMQRFAKVFKEKIDFLKMHRDAVGLLRTMQPALSSTHKAGASLDKTQVFVVHGRDDVAKLEVARFVEQLGLQPIILHEQPSSGRTIIEKIEAYSNVGFAIVLYTPCDIGGLKEEDPTLRKRARQNVVFEHGFLIGKIGRENVCALVKGDVETPNDISGVVFVPMDRHWKIDLAKELKSSGYDVDLNKAI